MKTFTGVSGALLILAMAASASAQTLPSTAEHAHPPASAATPATASIAPGAEAAVAVVDAFGKALAAADFEQVEAMLDPDVIILESGGAERSRSEYLGHHAKSDAKFLSGAHSALSRRIARMDGGTVWVASESELHARNNDKPVTLLSTETMVLEKRPSGWKIVHIHWSSRPKK